MISYALFLKGCVRYFTLRASLLFMETIEVLYKRYIMKAAAAPVGTSSNELDVDIGLRAARGRTPTHGYAAHRHPITASEQSNTNSEKSPRKLSEVMKRVRGSQSDAEFMAKASECE
jgi:hypothetical protein